MKKLLFTLTLAGTLALGSQSSFAQAKKKKDPNAPADAPATAPATPAVPATPTVAEKPKTEAKPGPFHTIVDSIDAKGQSFTHKNKDGKEVKNIVNSKTELKNGDKEAKFSDIKVGDEVTGMRLKIADNEYEIIKTSYIGAPKPKAEKPKKP